MLGQHYACSFFLPGTLAANHVIEFALPFDVELVHVSAAAQNNSDATLIVGTSADDNGYITSYAIGDSGTPVEKGALTDFNGALVTSGAYPQVSDGTLFMATLDFDGAAGTAAQNVTIVFTFQEG